MGSYGPDPTSEVVIALGSNQGSRVEHVVSGIKTLEKYGIKVLRTSLLYETAPMHVTDQPPFINAALLARTDLPPLQLLYHLKQIEKATGRDLQTGQRWGPRPLDLDVIFYGPQAIDHEALTVPHPRWEQRPFVQAPLADLLRPSDLERGFIEEQDPARSALGRLKDAAALWEAGGGEAQVGQPGLCRVLPVQRQIWELGSMTHIMGILNVTPDSFSDGGAHMQGPAAAVAAARAMVRAGAGIIDIGGQSTRPGSARVGPEEELARILPVIRAMREDSEMVHTPISVDTYFASVAAAAAAEGADVINDVSGGTVDAGMLPTVAALGLPFVAMHMRGDMDSMWSDAATTYDTSVASEVGDELAARAEAAMAAGVPAFHLILDPGLGFSKTQRQSAELLGKLGEMRRRLPGALGRMPLLVGPSRKRFIGSITGREDPRDRDLGTAAACVVAAAQGAEIMRVHNVPVVREALRVVDCVYRGTPLVRLEQTAAAFPVHPGRGGVA
ncbi:MAG: Dihydropteroate synthase-like protein [Monoraphidium minutum]|nr:MAG: Dihydropteroate synthase-like protein [Monoraphidium minutum]